MDENALLEIVYDLKKQIEELKGKRREEQIKELEEIENEKYLIEQKCQEEIEDYKYIISQQKDVLERIGNDNDEKNSTIGDLQTKLNNKEDEIQQMSQELKTKTNDYDFLQSNFNKKANEIEKLNEKLNKKKDKYKKYKNEDSIRLNNKGDYSKEVITINEMSEDKKNFAIRITRESLKTYDDHFKCAKHIKEEFEDKYGGLWLAILKPSGYGSHCLTYFDKCCIIFTMGEFEVTIAKTELGDRSLELVDKGDYEKVDILNNTLNKAETEFAIKTTKDSLRMHTKHSECVRFIHDKFENKYDGGWGVVLKTRNYGDTCIPCFEKFISFRIGEFIAVIEKTNLNDRTVVLQNKGNYNNYEILTNKMSNDQQNFAIETARKSLNKHDSHFQCAKYIVEQFENKYGGKWCTILSVRDYGSSYFTYCDSCYISFRMGEFIIEIAKTQKKETTTTKKTGYTITLYDKNNYDKYFISKNEMNKYQEDLAIETTRYALKRFASQFDCARHVKEKFESNYSGKWGVVICPRGYGDCSITYYDNCYICFEMGEFYVHIFKSST